MGTKIKVVGLAMAAAVAFASAPITSAYAQGTDQVKCYGTNGCKAQSA